MYFSTVIPPQARFPLDLPNRSVSLPALPLFHEPWWLDATGVPWTAAETANGAGTTGYWPFPMERRYGIGISRNPPLTPYLGPVVLPPPNLKNNKWDGFEHGTISELLGRAPALPVWSISLRPGLKQAGLLQAAGFTVGVRQTFLLSLADRTESDILASFHEERRRNIRQLETMLEIRNETGETGLLYKSLQATLQRKGKPLPYPPALMARLFEAACSRKQSALWVARSEGLVQGLLWHAWDGQRAYYLASSLAPGITDKRVMTALLWQAIKHSSSLGLQDFDFEGSMDPGIEAFFRNFGGRRELYLVLQKEASFIWRAYRRLRG